MAVVAYADAHTAPGHIRMAHPSDFSTEASALVSRMTLEEKVGFCSGKSFWGTAGCERLGLPPLHVSDGPVGLRKQSGEADHLGLGVALPATCFPSGANLGSSWDPSLIEEMAAALARECRAHDVAVILGPAINMKRSPLCGRNFEYFAEDPFLAGELAAAYVRGAQALGVGTSVKHFAANNQEYGRMRVDTRVDERTLRELYLPAFERAIVGSKPWTLMSAYNQINGHFCSESAWLLTTLLRESWGFEGVVVSDWGAVKDRVAGVACGCDLEMPASGGLNDTRVLEAIASGELRHEQLDLSVARIVSLLLAAKHASKREPADDPDDHDNANGAGDGTGSSAGTGTGTGTGTGSGTGTGPVPFGGGHARLLAANHAFARRCAAQTAVLLRNERGELPLRPSAAVALIGRMATVASLRYQGAGSSAINAHAVDEPLAAVRDAVEKAGAGGSVAYAPGYGVPAVDDQPAIEEAVRLARTASAARLFSADLRRSRSSPCTSSDRRCVSRERRTWRSSLSACPLSTKSRASTASTCACHPRWTPSSPR